jgi:hypothetical protein
VTALTTLGVPARVASAASQSVVAGLETAGHLPPGLREAAVHAAQQAFMTGLHQGSVVAAAAAVAAALVALTFLPARAGKQSAAAEPSAAEDASAADLAAARR